MSNEQEKPTYQTIKELESRIYDLTIGRMARELDELFFKACTPSKLNEIEKE